MTARENAAPTASLTPFADDAATFSVGGMTVENGREKMAFYGNLDLTRDKAGLALAHRLKALVDAAVHVLETDTALPDAVAMPPKTTTVRNPFG